MSFDTEQHPGVCAQPGPQSQGFTLNLMSRPAFVAHVRADYERWGRMVDAVGMRRK